MRTYKLDGERHEEVSFIKTVTAGKLATVHGEHLAKGHCVCVVGWIKHERWEEPDGESRSKVLIIAEHVELQPVRKAPEPAAARTPEAVGAASKWRATPSLQRSLPSQ